MFSSLPEGVFSKLRCINFCLLNETNVWHDWSLRSQMQCFHRVGWMSWANEARRWAFLCAYMLLPPSPKYTLNFASVLAARSPDVSFFLEFQCAFLPKYQWKRSESAFVGPRLLHKAWSTFYTLAKYFSQCHIVFPEESFCTLRIHLSEAPLWGLCWESRKQQ